MFMLSVSYNYVYSTIILHKFTL